MLQARHSKLPGNLARAVVHMREVGRVSPEIAIRKALSAIREHLGMSSSFLSEFSGGQRRIRYVDSGGGPSAVKVGDTVGLETSYCQRIVDGRLPQVIPDTSSNREAMSLPITQQLPIGSHASVPVRFSDNSVYGTLCCLDSQPNPELEDSDSSIMTMLATFIAEYLEWDLPRLRRKRAIFARTSSAIELVTFKPVFQPIVTLDGKSIVGHEALTRFDGDRRSPADWFSDAEEVGLAAQLERAVAKEALNHLRERPDSTYVSINFSPRTLLAEETRRLLLSYPLKGVAIELTEHVPVEDYLALHGALDKFKEAGALIAVDDVGAGYAGLRHILELRPDIIKLDMSLTAHVADDPAREALVESMASFAQHIGSSLVAECIQREVDAHKLRDMGIAYGQGNYFAEPSSAFHHSIPGDAGLLARSGA